MKLNQVMVGSTDYAASVAFYRSLGLTQIVEAPPRYARFETPAGETLSIHAMSEVRSSTILYFEVDDVDAAIAGLAAGGIIPIVPPTDQPWLWREARLADPDGNVICLYHAGDNRRFPPWRMSAGEGPA
ncbi:VOC family protein [Sphingomonas crusticola]|uniref:VOC family protein n=1 Tax=Sphingomonas crusticola TaxID=1697973 RepID=UPI000E24CEBF|nr:VOC family protein [Sphingomonas crusticola]